MPDNDEVFQAKIRFSEQSEFFLGEIQMPNADLIVFQGKTYLEASEAREIAVAQYRHFKEMESTQKEE